MSIIRPRHANLSHVHLGTAASPLEMPLDFKLLIGSFYRTILREISLTARDIMIDAPGVSLRTFLC
jgi:hypothetical protein